jgi:Glycosyltransferase family 87/WD40-like Beta Propeller Repeat
MPSVKTMFEKCLSKFGGHKNNSCFGQFAYIVEWLVVTLLTLSFTFYAVPHAWRLLNTDFPDYYLAAHFIREDKDASRAYEWVWLERQKDYIEMDQRIVGLVPLTPFSTLVVWPLTRLSPLAAKHCWIAINLGMLVMIGLLIKSLTELQWRRICFVMLSSFPLQRNLLYGQYYVLLLFILLLACWLYVRQCRILSGVLIGLGSGLKIFPVIYLIYFLKKKDFKALGGGFIGCAFSLIVAVFVFGWQLHRVYVFQVLPWVLRGEGLDPYNLATSSISSVLHRLFIFEPQWNPHPAFNAPWIFAVLHPLLQMVIIAPALLLVFPMKTSSRQLRLEWGALLVASLTISTSSSSYLFTLLIFSVCVLWKELEERGSVYATSGMLVIYATAIYPGWKNAGWTGWSVLFGAPRLYASILLCLLFYLLLMPQRLWSKPRREQYIWTSILAVVSVLSIISNLHHQRGLYEDYRWRLSMPNELLMAVNPVIQDNSIYFIALLQDGYHLAVEHLGEVRFSDSSESDLLGVAAAKSGQWVEHVGSTSRIVLIPQSEYRISQAESPVASFDGSWLGYLREDGGRTRIWVHSLNLSTETDKVITPPNLNVYEMSFFPNGSLVFAATRNGGKPELFIAEQSGSIRSLGEGEARYPSVSPDGHWLAYSKLERGNWNLWLHDLHNDRTSRLTHAECNSIQPTWSDDSRTLVYASDCGRALWFTALCRRTISQ